jgi:hypothetical protein
MKALVSLLLIILGAFLAPLRAATPNTNGPTTFTARGSFSFNIPAGFAFQTQTGEQYPIFVNSMTNYTAYMQVAPRRFSRQTAASGGSSTS